MPIRQTRAILRILLASALVATGIYSLPPLTARAIGKPIVPYSLGNWTYIDKPVCPVKVNASQIPIGNDWTYACELSDSSSYHVYFYGDWIGSGTDYDVYVYNPRGELETIHTEAAGLPEHLGTTVEKPFFTPECSGVYCFRIVNDIRESQGEKAATLMVIEHIDCNRWHQRALQGKVRQVNVYKTTWAYELMTASDRVEVWVDVPNTLDMYEARLYAMANPSRGIGVSLNGVPLAWEPGLYGAVHTSRIYGGYNLDDEGFRKPDATASCEYPGQDMLINYTSPSPGDMLLYHLVFIGEYGTGNIRFMVQTDFEAPSLSIPNPVRRTEANSETTITAEVSDQDSGLESVLLSYTTDDWGSSTSIGMSPSQGQEHAGTIPGQPAGTTVDYKVTASDAAGNIAEEEGNYIVKDPANITFSLSKPVIYANEGIGVNGRISCGGAELTLNYTCEDETVLRLVTADSTGSFTDQYAPNRIGDWVVSAEWRGDETHFEAYSGYKNFTVEMIPTSVDCFLSREAVYMGEAITINGTAEPATENMAVELEITMPNNSVTRRHAQASPDGTFSISLMPDLEGSWSVQAKYAGDHIRLPSASTCRNFTVQRVPTSLDCAVSKEAIHKGERVDVTGVFQPPLGNMAVMLRLTKPDGKVVEEQVHTSFDGTFGKSLTPDPEGSWSVQAKYAGDRVYLPSISSIKNFTVQKIRTSVDCVLNREAIDIGEQIAITGAVEPAVENLKVELWITMPNSLVTRRDVQTGSDGTFNSVFTADSAGSWGVQAKYAGDAFRLPSSSQPKSFVVNNTWMNTIMSFVTQYWMYIAIAAGVAGSVSGFLVYLRRRG